MSLRNKRRAVIGAWSLLVVVSWVLYVLDTADRVWLAVSIWQTFMAAIAISVNVLMLREEAQ